MTQNHIYVDPFLNKNFQNGSPILDKTDTENGFQSQLQGQLLGRLFSITSNL